MATQYGFGKIVTDGLVLALDAADRNSYVSGSLIWNDLSLNNNNGTLTNGASFNSENGGNIIFDGVDDYVDVGSNASLAFGTGNFTINIYFSIASIGGGINDWVSPICKGNWNGGNYTVLINRDPNHPSYKIIRFYINSSTVISTVLDQAGIIPNKIYNYSVSRESTTVSAYINGVFSNSASNSSNIQNTFSVRIGAQNNGFYYLDGKVYNAQIYNRALSAQEILQNYNVQKSRFNL